MRQRAEAQRSVIGVWIYLGLVLAAAVVLLVKYRPQGVVGYAVLLGVPLLCFTPPALWGFDFALELLERLSRRPAAAMALVGVLSVILPAVFCWRVIVPAPEANDEFSYMLAADTFAHGRLSNPQHPMWVHFETIHVLQRPTYASKYPPGQGLTLALGQVVFYLPLAGAWIASAMACAAVTWALYAFVPGRWAVLGGMLAALSGTMLDWNLCYWGGSLGMMAGAVVVGAYGRLRDESESKRRWLNGMLLGLGLGVFALSRPFEGLLIGGAIGVGLIVRMARGDAGGAAGFWKVVFAGALALAPCLVFLGIYNRAVTGLAWRLPYSEHDAQYCRTPHLLLAPLKPARAYNHEVLRYFHDGWEADHWRRQHTLRGYLHDAKEKAFDFLSSVADPPYLVLALAALPWALRRDRRLLFPAAALCFFVGAHFVVTWGLSSHYAGAATVLFLAVLLPCLMKMSEAKWGSYPVGRAAATALIVLFLYATARSVPPLIKDKTSGWKHDRYELIQKLERQGGKHLIFVRYLGVEDYHHMATYNGADIDGSAVVWANDMSAEKNAELMAYYPERIPWVMTMVSDGEERRPKILPYFPPGGP